MRQTNAYKDNSARKTTKVRKKNGKTEQKAAYYVYEAWTGDTLYLHSSTWKARMSSLIWHETKTRKRRSSLGGGVTTWVRPFIAGRRNCVRTNELQLKRLHNPPRPCQQECSQCLRIWLQHSMNAPSRRDHANPSFTHSSKEKNTRLQKAATGSMSRRCSFIKTLSHKDDQSC